MKVNFILFLMIIFSLNTQAQSSGGVKKCLTCNKPIGTCEYRGKHPVQPQSKPETKPSSEKPSQPKPIAKPKTQIPKPADVKSHTDAMKVNGGIYSGDLLNGIPHGNGKIIYKEATLISKFDPEERYAYPDESIEGHFENGDFVYGIYHSIAGDRKIFFGSKSN